MKKTLLLIFLMCAITQTAQSLEDTLNNITSKIAKNLQNHKKYTIAVYPFMSLKSQETALTLHTFNEFHSALKNKEKPFKLMDRETIENYLSEHQLNSEGLIDKDTAKKFGKLIAADAYVSGKVYIFGSVIYLTIKLTNTETGEVISFSSEKAAIDYDMAQFLEIKNWKEKKQQANLNKSQNPNCNTLNVGDYCFYNNTAVLTEVRIKPNASYNRYHKKIIIPINTKTCFNDLQVGSYNYQVERLDRLKTVVQSNIIFQGNFVVEKCGSQLQKLSQKSIKSISDSGIIK